MKTPEEMAEECKNKIAQRDIYAMGTLSQRELDYLKEGYLAGYKAAQEHAHAALEEAEARIQELQDQLADADKVINSSNNSNGWISVKDRLPEKKDIGDIFLVWNAYERDVSTVRWQLYGFDDVNDMYISHWMPLPEIPEDKGKAHWQELREFWKARNVTISEWQEEK